MLLNLVLFLFALYVAYVLWFVVFKPMAAKKIDLRKMGKWAVVTGATDGIGKALACEIAKQGVNVALISRTESKLRAVSKEIESLYKVRTKIIVADFTQGYQIYDKIRDQLKGLEVGVLVNNVGMCYECPEHFLKVEGGDKTFLDMITCNTFAMTFMTSMLLPQMVQRSRGVILNLSSIAGIAPGPLFSVYAATKTFNDKLSRDLQTEYADKGIIIQSIIPGYVVTNMSQNFNSGVNIMAPSAETYAQKCIRTISAGDQMAPYLPHRLLAHVVHVMNFVCPDFIRRNSMREMKRIRAEYLAKQKKE